MIVIGADLGQAQDPTALAVAEVHPPEIHVRHLERLSLGTPYPKVVERIADLVDHLPGAALVVDATGVGRAVLDQMREAGLEPVPVTITGGRFTSFDGNHWRVPKKAVICSVRLATTKVTGSKLPLFQNDDPHLCPGQQIVGIFLAKCHHHLVVVWTTDAHQQRYAPPSPRRRRASGPGEPASGGAPRATGRCRRPAATARTPSPDFRCCRP